MSVLTRLAAFLVSDPRAQRAMVLEQRAAFAAGTLPTWAVNKPVWLAHDPATYVRDGWGKAPVVYACVSYLADAVSTATVRVTRATGGGQTEYLDDHPLRALLQAPNPGMSEAEFLVQMVVNAALAGYAVAEKQRDGLGNVVGLYPLRSDWLRPVPRQQSAPAWEYRIPGVNPVATLEPEDVVVYTHSPSPELHHTGTAPSAVALRELGIENAATDFLKAFFDRGALPVYGIIPKAPVKSQAEADTFIERLIQKYGGSVNSVRPMLLTGVEDVKKLGLDFDEMAYPALRDLTELHITMAFRVPPILIGAKAGLDRSTYSNYAEARTHFYEDVVTPLWARLDGAFTRSLLPEFTDDPAIQLTFDTSDVPAMKDDETPKWQRATAAVQAGWITINDARREAGLPQLAGGDVRLVPFNVVETPATVEGRAARGRAVAWIDAPYRLPEPAVVTRDGRRYVNAQALSPAQIEQRAKLAQHNRAVQAKLAAALEPRLVQFFTEQGARIVPLITGSRSTPLVPSNGQTAAVATRAVEVVDWDAEYSLLRDLLIQFYGEATAAGFDLAASQLGMDIPWDISNPVVQRLVTRLGTRITGISETTRATVERIVLDALSEGTSISELADKLTGLFEETYKGRATTVARTEAQAALNQSAAEGYIAGGVREVELMDNSQHDTDPGGDGLTCAARDSLIVPVRNVPLHSNGTHPNCVLAIRPILEVPA